MAVEVGRELEADAVAGLRTDVRGAVLLPEESGYDEARAVWNAMIDRRPAVIVRALGAADVRSAVAFAREHDLELAVRGGGHNVAGNAVCDDGLVVDCSLMRSVRVDPEARTARVEPGCTLHDVDVETGAHGLALPLGFISSTGVAGLTLGGGFGYLSRKHGLTVDHLRSVDLVTAEGEFVTASELENPDLFWALRGGGGNFGVVTAFEYDLVELSGPVYCGPIAYELGDAPAVMRAVAARMRDAPNELCCLLSIRRAPPVPFLPESSHGELVLLVVFVHAGDAETGETVIAPFREIGEPIADALAPRPYAVMQTMFDAAGEAGARNYWKAHYLDDLTDAAIDTLCEHGWRVTTPESTIGLMTLGGAVAEVPDDATPYPHRDAGWALNIMARWRDPETEAGHIRWARDLFRDVAPETTGGVYVNFISGDEGEARVKEAYGPETYERLAEVKREWDPDNVFHLNQNVKPARK